MTKQLKFYISNNIEALAAKWISSTQYHKDIFKPHIILTQTQGMNNWLKLQRVKTTGQSTNILFITPNDFLLKIYDTVHVNNSVKISNRHIDWLIYKILSGKNFQTQFPHISLYYKNSDNSINELQLWELAYQTTDLFDQYQIYRQDTLRAWLNDNVIDKDYDWQQFIWKELHVLLGDKLIDLSKMQNDVLELLEQDEIRQRIINQYDHISLFGISILSPYHIQMLYKLSEIIRIDFYMLNPSPEVFWDLDKSEKQLMRFNNTENFNIGHELLTNWGKIIQTTFRLLHSDDEIFNNSEILSTKEYPQNTLLNAIKNTIFNNDIEKQNWPIELISDKSIEINAHYNIQNEVTGLYNYILNITQTRKDIKDSDILIICADINKYAPYIRTIFSNNAHNLHHTIADESTVNRDSIISTLTDILSFNFIDFKIEDIFKLLEHQSIRKKFNITDIPKIQDIVLALNIKFGIESQSTDDTHLFSWVHGMKKCFLDICMFDQDFIDIDGQTFPLKNIADDNNTINELNQFFEFIDQMIIIGKKTHHEMTLSQCKIFIDDLIQKIMYNDGEDYIEEYEYIIQQMNQIEAIDEIIGYEKIPYSVFSHKLTVVLQHLSAEAKFMKRGITFCSPIPFRSVPFKVIGFLGMNAVDFPRLHKESSVNYMHQHPQLGDRNLKDNDKHLFLESLLAAEEKFYISYIGKNSIDNTTLSPSIIVDELIDYIQSQVDQNISVENILCHLYPLNNFSHQYNKQDSKLNPNFLIEAHREPISIYKRNSAKAILDKIDWKDVISFFDSPAKYYFTKIRKIYFEESTITADHTEKLFLAGGGENTLIQNALVKEFLYNNKCPNTLLKHHYLDGNLPLKNIGTVEIMKLNENIDNVISKISKNVDHTKKENRQINIHLEQIQLSYAFETFDDSMMTYTTSSLRYSRLMKLFLEQILVQSQGYQFQYRAFDKERSIKLPSMSTSDSQDWLMKLLKFYVQHREKPLAADTSNINIEKKFDINKSSDISAFVKKEFSREHTHYLNYLLDNYRIEDHELELQELFKDIYSPIFERLKTVY